MTNTKIDDGGPDRSDDHRILPGAKPGMSLRDWFAGLAMQAMVAGHRKHNRDPGACDPTTRRYREQIWDFTTPDCEGVTEDSEAHAGIIAQTSYEVADAMLSARKQPPAASGEGGGA